MSKQFQKVNKGITFRPQASTPADLEDGDVYFNSTLQKFRQKTNGIEADLGGTGVGDITNIEARLQSRFQLSSWRAMTPNVIANDQATKVFSSTGTLETQDYLLDSGENLISTQNLDAEFLAAGVLPSSAEVQVCYDLSAVDTNPTVQLSRDGGATLQTVNVEREAGDDSWRGNIVFEDTEANVTVDEYAVGNADTLTELNTTTQQALSQGFILSATQVVKQFTVYLNKAGTPSGNYFLSIVRDDGSGKPSTSQGDYLFKSAPRLLSDLSSGNNTVLQTIPGSLTLPAGTYHVVVETDGAYKASFVTSTTVLNFRTDNSAPTAPGIGNTYNGTAYSNATWDGTYLIEGFALDLRFKVTSGTNGSKLKGYGVFYDKGIDATVGRSNRYEVAFDGATNPTSFDLTNSGFIPDDKLLLVIWANTGQVFVHPVFDVSGYSVIFAANQFLSSGAQRLIFWQPLGSSFDNNEKNAALLAENRLGSSTPSLDRSVAGEGILLRASDGELVEASIQWNGSNYVWQFAVV